MTATPRIDRRRLRTRAALLSAGQALFAERSVDGVSIDDIVAAADVAKGSFYNHFPDKEALARALADAARASVEDLVAKVSAGASDPVERMARAQCAFARQAVENPVGVAAMQRLFPAAGIPDAPMNRGVRAEIHAALAAGRFQGLPLEAAILLVVGATQVMVARIVEQKLSPDGAAGLARDVVFGALRGLGLDPAAARTVADKAAADIFSGPSPAG